MNTSQPSGKTPSEPSASTQTGGVISNLMEGKTPAMKNMEEAYSRAGAGNNHTPGSASKLGSQEQPKNSEGAIGSKKFEDTISDQREQPSMVGKFVNQVLNGSDKGK